MYYNGFSWKLLHFLIFMNFDKIQGFVIFRGFDENSMEDDPSCFKQCYMNGLVNFEILMVIFPYQGYDSIKEDFTQVTLFLHHYSNGMGNGIARFECALLFDQCNGSIGTKVFMFGLWDIDFPYCGTEQALGLHGK